MAPRPAAKPVDDWKTVEPNDWQTVSGNQRSVLDEPHRPTNAGEYQQQTIANIPQSVTNLIGNVANAVGHPIETGKAIGTVAAGAAEKLGEKLGFPVPEDKRQNIVAADAAWDALKKRYGSLQGIADTIRTDPVGVAADISALAGGVGATSRGVGLAADVAKLPRVANVANRAANVAATVADVTNPVNLATQTAAALGKGTARGLTRVALGLPGRTERFGATPAQAALEQTSGFRPKTIAASARDQLKTLEGQLDTLVQRQKTLGTQADLTPAIDVIRQKIARLQSANSDASDLFPMRDQLIVPKTGFGGATTNPMFPGQPSLIEPLQDVDQFLEMKRAFGNDWTKFDYSIPMKNDTRALGNQAYHELSQEFNRAVPESQPINQQIQSLVPVEEGARRAAEKAGPVQRIINRATRPTGGMTPVLAGTAAGGPVGGAAVLAAQETMGSPSALMMAARPIYSGSKLVGSPITSRLLNTGALGTRLLTPGEQ
jgi:hypothetical protein